MKFHHIRLVYLVPALVLMSACSTHFLGARFTDFSDSTALLGKNVDYVIEQSRAEELNVRRAEALGKETVSPIDFQPGVLTVERVETRKELTRYITMYAELLTSLVESGDRGEFQRQALKIYANIRNINTNHSGFLKSEEQGILSACAAAIPEAMTAAKRRHMLLRLMSQNQPRLEKITTLLTEELQQLQILLNNFYRRQFRLLVGNHWTGPETRREMLAKRAQEMTARRERLDVIFTDLIRALDYIPRTHKQLLAAVRSHGNPVQATADLLDFAARIESNFKEFSQGEGYR